MTNKSGFYYPLSGLDTNGNYYSFMELDAWDWFLQGLGFYQSFNSYIVNGSLATPGDTGSVTDTETAVLFIHDDPTHFNAPDDPNASLYYSPSSLEIQGILKFNINATRQKVVGTFTGIGIVQLPVSRIYQGVITAGKATFTPE